jgi:predicted esterase
VTAAPVVAWRGAPRGERPLVVLLHGCSSNESDIVTLAEHLPAGLDYAAVRAPIEEGGGYAWFANRGIGRPVAESPAEAIPFLTLFTRSTRTIVSRRDRTQLVDAQGHAVGEKRWDREVTHDHAAAAGPGLG